uniref:Ribosomal protein S21 n=1 Tax=Oryza meridionalis TaxID=40149 RepID=A0A0E0D4W3_9ORYZ
MHRKEKSEGRSSSATHTAESRGGGGAREPAMQALARAARGILPAPAPAAQVQQARGIVVHVKDGNLERALGVMARKMRSSGIERLIRARSQIHHHVKDSEKRVLARKALMQRVRSQELGKKLRDILIKKIRGQ